MPRYGPPPSDDAPPPPEDERSPRRKWSWGAKLLAVIAAFGMVAAFVFEFLPPTSPKDSQKISTTVAVTTTLSPSTTAPPSTTATTELSTTTSSLPLTATTR